MRNEKELRGLAGHNGAGEDKMIISHRRLWRKVRRAALYGTVAGALAAVIIGGIMIDTEPLRGFLTALPGAGWLYLFYWVNKEDQIYDVI